VRKAKPLVIVLLFVLVATALGTIPSLRRSIPCRIVRWCLGEPGATQFVNDAAEEILSSGWDTQLVELSNQIMDESVSNASTLPVDPYTGGRLLSLDRIPPKLKKLSKILGNLDEVLLLCNDTAPAKLVLSWGHRRYDIIIYAEAPSAFPEGFFVRKVRDRVYIIAYDI
jgi:hypothetical protein